MDRLLATADAALRTVAGHARSVRPYPPGSGSGAPAAAAAGDDDGLDAPARREAGALMRVNHVGEVCAQALYEAQALAARNATVRAQMAQAARDETDHLAWTEERLRELGAHPSVLNPLWYAGAFALGLAAGRLGDRWSLGFVVETERQVEQHLAGHLERLPAQDQRSRSIVAQMKDDERRHGDQALAAGAQPLPLPARALMRAAARVMTTTARYL
ncbi:MAG: 2-polyprenyl-3-methyl-6-methoxy-1,4-benzoquinone monooxygenase [Rubrivivax sp.]|nr:2-polyprenyl-3-methyl-6-methoxy-1,4-benzoquinone monooxygenase [Rubrivivax sp.]